MHERTERALCRLAFLALCALPTMLTIGVAGWTRTPWHYRRQIAALEQTLQLRLGLEVEVGGLRCPAPGVWELQRVILRDPETGDEVARVREVAYAVISERVIVHLSQPEIKSAQLNLVWRLVHDRFLCQPDLLESGLRLTAEDLSLHSHVQGLTLSPVRVEVEPRADKTLAIVRFKLADGGAREEPAQLEVTRSRDGDRPRTEWSLKTGSEALPCSVLADYLPAMRRLGVQAEFKGILDWELDREDYKVTIAGATFTNVNLSELLEPFDHRISGLGTIEVQELVRHSGQKIAKATGSIVMRDAKIDTPLLQAMGKLANVRVAPMPPDIGPRVACQLLAMHIQLNGDNLHLSGIAYRQPNFEYLRPGPAILANNVPIVEIDPRRSIDAEALTGAFDPHRRVGLPVGLDQNWEQGLLPEWNRVPQTSEAPQVRGLRIEDQTKPSPASLR